MAKIGCKACCVKVGNSLLCAGSDPLADQKSWGRKCVDCLKPTSDEPPEETGPDEGPTRETWGNRCTFFISTLGMSVGLGQVWRFPTLAYSKGGGAFLIMYGIVMFLIGNCIFFFEICNGQYTSKNPLRVYDKVPLFVGIGWSMISYSYLFCTYYSHMVAFSLYYLYRGFTLHLPWSYCPPEDDILDKYTCVPYSSHRKPDMDGFVCGIKGLVYNRTLICSSEAQANTTQSQCCGMAGVTDKKECEVYFNVGEICRKREYPSTYFWNHVVTRSYREGDPKFGFLGPLVPHMAICSFLSWFIAYLTLYKGLKSLGFMMYIMVPLPYIVLIIMFAVVIPQNGASFGLKEFFIPKPESFINMDTWRVAAEQAFYSTGVAMGPLITFGSYSKFNNPSHIDAILICLCIFLTSVLCSLVVFSVLGFLSVKTGKPFNDVCPIGPGLVFIVYPESIELLPAAPFFSFLFYLMLINLGLSSVTGIIETVSSAVYDIWPKTRNYKYLINLGILSSCFLLGLPITARGGLVVYNAFDTYSAGIPLIPICILELVIIVFIYGLGRFCEDTKFMIGFYPNRYYRYIWMIGPFLLAVIFIYGMVVNDFGDQKLWSLLTGIILCILVMIWVFVGMIFTLVTYKKLNKLKEVLKAPPSHGPKKQVDFEQRALYSVPRKIF